VPLIAKSEKVEDVSKFLEAGSELSKAEEETFQWYGIKYVDHTPPTFAVLDTFRTEEGRKAHLAGKIAEALMANANTLLSSGPEITPVNIVASHVRDCVDKDIPDLT
jgi:quinol monooxygenase YgiN